MRIIFTEDRTESLIWIKRPTQSKDAFKNPVEVTLWPHFLVAMNDVILRRPLKPSGSLKFPFGEQNIRKEGSEGYYEQLKEALGISSCDIKNLWPRFNLENLRSDFQIDLTDFAKLQSEDDSINSITSFVESCIKPDSVKSDRQILIDASGLTESEIEDLWGESVKLVCIYVYGLVCRSFYGHAYVRHIEKSEDPKTDLSALVSHNESLLRLFAHGKDYAGRGPNDALAVIIAFYEHCKSQGLPSPKLSHFDSMIIPKAALLKEIASVLSYFDFEFNFIRKNISSGDVNLEQLANSKNPLTIKKVEAAQRKLKASNHPNPKNIILYGPPGTGKTYAAMLIASDIISGHSVNLNTEELHLREYPRNFKTDCGHQYFGTQFHPSFSYEDFMEGLRPVQVQNGSVSEISYMVVPGVFKAACQIARAYLEPGHYGIDLKVQFVMEEGKGTWKLENHAAEGIYRLSDRAGYLTYNDKVVLQTGECGINVNVDDSPSSDGIYSVKWYSSNSGGGIDFVLFIDELNRGNPAKVFGEALSLIEDTKRYGKREEGEITLPYSRERFVVPPNLHLICCMNSSDKSLMNLDQAFRRRFEFIYFPPAFEIITTESFRNRSENVFGLELLRSLQAHFDVINRALRLTDVPQENLIGHSYVIKALRLSYSAIKKNKDLVVSDVVRENLMMIWRTELHSQIREIVGDQRLSEFCDNFAAEAGKSKSEDSSFLSANGDVAKMLFKYLDDIQPVRDHFPWKKIA